jgi:uncharacterized protein YkwD
MMNRQSFPIFKLLILFLTLLMILAGCSGGGGTDGSTGTNVDTNASDSSTTDDNTSNTTGNSSGNNNSTNPNNGPFSAIAGNGQITFYWTAISNTNTYTLYIAQESGVTTTGYSNLTGGTRIANLTGTSYNLINLINYQTYYAILTPETDEGEGNALTEISTKPMREDYLHMNSLRKQVSLNQYNRQSQLEQSALAHATWGVENDKEAHNESSGDTNYTGDTPQDRTKVAGYKGYNSTGEVISYQDTDIESIDNLMSAIYHRFGLMRNDVDEIGFGFATDSSGSLNNSFVGNNGNSKISLVCQGVDFTGAGSYYSGICDPDIRIKASEYEEARDYWAGRNPVLTVWPPENSSDILPVFFEESPDPLPDYSVSGYPVSVQFNEINITSIQLSSFKIYENDSGTEITNTRLLDQGSDPNNKFSSHQFALFPLVRLTYGKTYRVELSYVQDGLAADKTWTFTTKSPGAIIHTITANGDSLTMNSGETVYIYIPPTSSYPTIGSCGYNYPTSTTPQMDFYDGNTLMIKNTGDSGDQIDYTLGTGTRTFSITLL